MAWRQKLNNAVDKYKPSVPSQVAAIAQVTRPEGGIGQTNEATEQSRIKPASATTLGNLSDSVEDTLRQLEAFAQSLEEAGRPDEIAQIEASRAREKLRRLSPSLGMEFAPAERGLLVTKCVPGEAGERSGFRVGDVLVKIGARAAKEDKALKDLKAGETVAVELERRQSELVVNLFTLRLKVGAAGVPFADLEAIVDAAAFPENYKGPVPDRWAGLVDGSLVQALTAAGAQAEDAHKSIAGSFANVMRAGSLIGDTRDGRSPMKGDSRLSDDKKTVQRGSSENTLRRNSSVLELEDTDTKEAEDTASELAEGDFGTLTESALQESEKLRQMTSLTMPDMTRARSILLWEPSHEDSVSEHSEMESISSEPLDARDGERPSVMMHMPSEPRREVSGPTPPSSDCEEEKSTQDEPEESNEDRPFVDYFLAMSVVPSPAYLARAALHPVEDIGEDTYASVRSRRYPLVDRVGSPMPESVSVFTFGAGAKTIYVHNDGSSEDNQRLAKVAGVVYFAFILTDVHSGRLYASCAQYYTAVPNTAGVYAARTLCFLSRVPFLHSFREALTVLVAMEGCSVDPTIPSPEQLVTHLTEEVRVPRPGGPTVRFMVGGKQLELTMPEERDFPLLDHDLRALFDRLTVDNVLAILVCILTEQKIVVHSSRSVDLTYVTEACLALIFPFRWYHVYIPVLPTALLDVCDAPVPFLVGMQTSLLDSLISDTKDKMMLVDLDRNSVKYPRKFKTRLPSKLQTSIKQQIMALLHPELTAGPRGSTTRRNSSSVSRSIEPEDCTAEGFDQELTDGPLASALALDSLTGGSEPSVGAGENDVVPESVAISLTEPGARGSTSLSLPVSPPLARGESEVRPPPSLSMGDTTTQEIRRNSLSVAPDSLFPVNDSPAPRRDSLSVIDHTSPPIHTTKTSPILSSSLSTRRGSFPNNVSPNTPTATRRETLSEPFPISLGAEVDHELNSAIRKVFLEAFSLLLQDFRQFLFFMGDGVPIFNAEEFVNLHKRRHTDMLETEEPRRSKLKWLGVSSHPAPVQPFLRQFLSTHVFAMFLEECQYPSVFHVYLSTRQTQGTRRLALGASGRSLGCLRVPAPVPHHPYYPATMTPHHVNTIKKQIKLRRLRPSPVPVVSSSSFWRSSKSSAPATHHVPFEPDLSLPFPARVCDWLETKREWNVPARSMAALYASQPPMPVPKYLQAKRRREKALRRCQNSESFNRLQTFLSYVFLSTKPEAGKQAERMHNLFLQCKRSLGDKQTRRGLALLLDHPANLVSQKSRLSARKFASMSSLIKKFLDACLKDRDYKSSVSALTAGSTFFCLKRNPRPEHGLSAPLAPPTPDSPRAQSLTDFLNAPQSPGSPEGDDEELPEVEGNAPEASDPDLLSYFLENSLRDHPIFLHSAFWRKAFREALQKLSLQDELLSFEPEGRQDLVQLLGMMINKMLFFGRSISFVTNFIREKSVGLSESDSKMLEMLALNIFRAR